VLWRKMRGGDRKTRHGVSALRAWFIMPRLHLAAAPARIAECAPVRHNETPLCLKRTFCDISKRVAWQTLNNNAARRSAFYLSRNAFEWDAAIFLALSGGGQQRWTAPRVNDRRDCVPARCARLAHRVFFFFFLRIWTVGLSDLVATRGLCLRRQQTAADQRHGSQAAGGLAWRVAGGSPRHIGLRTHCNVFLRCGGIARLFRASFSTYAPSRAHHGGIHWRFNAAVLRTLPLSAHAALALSHSSARLFAAHICAHAAPLNKINRIAFFRYRSAASRGGRDCLRVAVTRAGLRAHR